jgi:site-specific recombinase XerD
MSALAPTLQASFTERLIRERNASPHTIAAYRDTMRLLLRFASQRLCKEPSQLEISDLDAPLISAFLDHLERDRGCGPRTRNGPLTAIRSLFRFAARHHPEHAAVIERVLAIPPRRTQRTLITTSPSPKSTRSSTPPTARPRPAGAITSARSRGCDRRRPGMPRGRVVRSRCS